MQLLENRFYWYWVSFITGLASLALEISASRLLAPHFGTSTVVWSSVIGVVLLALSVGYYVGGRLAEKNSSPVIPLRILLIGGIFTLCIPLLAKGLLDSFALSGTAHNITFYLSAGSLLACLLLFAPPVFLLGCMSPYILSILTARFGHVANTAGRLYAISTIGSLLGAFLPTLLLIPWLGTTKSILLMGGLLVLTGIPGLLSKKHVALTLTASLLLTAGIAQLHTQAPQVLASVESPYQHIKITETTSGIRYMQFDAGFGVQSVYMKDRVLTGLYYYDYASMVPGLLPSTENQKRVLILGLAGGTVARQLQTFYGNTVHIEAVELDPASTKLAKAYMHLDDIPLTIHSRDGRTFLKSSKGLYDFIYVDTYQNELQIPWVNTTQEFWQEVREHLTPSGIVGLNIAALGSEQNSLVKAIANTQTTVFPYVYDAPLAQHRNSSHLVIGSLQPLDFSRWTPLTAQHTELRPLTEYLQKNLTLQTYSEGEQILTDDHAPLEWLMARDILDE